MNKLLKKRMLIISISLALLLLINIGVSYSYYLGKVVGNESDTTLSFKSAGIIVQYENNSGEITAGDILSGWSTTKNFSLSSSISENDFTNENSKLWYEMFLYVDQNDFLSNLITYTLTSNETIVGNGQVAEARTSVGIETGTNEGGISLGLGYFTVGSNIHNYSITFNYTDNGSEYSNYPDNIFSVHIGAKVVISSSIIIDLDGGTIEGATTKYVSKGGTIILPVPTKNGYIFDGWVKTSGEGVIDGNSVTVNSEVLNLSAVWKSKSISSILVLDLDGGTSTQDTINNIKTHEIQTLETPTKSCYVFRGWKLVNGDAELSGNKLVAYDESVRIIATWESVVPVFTYTGNYKIINDPSDNWRIKFLSSGTLTFETYGNAESGIDVFLVGGGGNGDQGGGGGGYTKTQKNIQIVTSTSYSITVGGAGSSSKAFGYTVSGGGSGNGSNGGSGGSGGGAGGSSNNSGGNGGSDGGGGGTSNTRVGGSGQGTTTREFGESSGTLYAGGGGGSYSGIGGSGGGADGAGYKGVGGSGGENTGGGGGGTGGGSTGVAGSGGSGIVIIRNARG